MAHSIRSPYENELVDSGHDHDGIETYRVERTEIIRHSGNTHEGHDGHLAHSHGGSTTHEHSIHGHNSHGNGHKYGKNIDPHQHRLGENAVPALVQAFSGAIGASIANLAVHPLDLIIKRLQVQRQIEMRLRSRGARGSANSPPRHVSQTFGGQSSSGDHSPVHVVLGAEEIITSTDEGGNRSYTYGHTTTTTTTTSSGFMGRESYSEEFEMEGHYSGVIDAAQKIWAQEGLGGFYTGVVEETVGTLGSAFWYFAVYSYLRNKRLHKRHSQSLPVLEELLIGLAAGSVSKLFLTPFNTVAIRKQTHAMLYPGQSTGIVTIYHDIMREKGITGFWSGYSASAFLSLNPTITFLIYESLKGFAGGKRRRMKGAETFLLAAVAKAIATGMTYPLAVARSRAQIETEDDDLTGGWTGVSAIKEKVGGMVSRKARRSGNVIEVLVDIFKREGIAALYEGVLGELLRGFVSSGITLVIKESVHRTILSLYYFVMRAYNRSGDHTFQATTKIMAKDAYDNAGPRQKKLMNKAIEGVGKVTSSASHGKAKVVGLVGASHAAHKLSEVREKISETTGIGKDRREGSNHKGMKIAAATVAVAGITAGAIHAHKRKDRQDEHGSAIVHTAHERNERYDEHGNAIVHTAHERNERHDEHGNVIVHTARERVEEWREGVDDERIHAAKVSHSRSHSGHIVDNRIHNGQVSHSHSHSPSGHIVDDRIHNGQVSHSHSHSPSGHIVDDRIHTGEMRQQVVEMSTHSASGGVGSRIGGRHNGVTEHTRIEERVQHNHSGSGSHSRRGSTVASGVVGAVTAGALGHKLSSHSQHEHHSNSNSHGGIVGAVTGAAHKLTGHSHTEHTHSSHGNHGGLVGAASGATLGHKLSSHSHHEQSHNSSHGSLAPSALGVVAGGALGHKLSGYGHNEHSHSSSQGGLVSSHSHNGHSGHVGLASGVVGAVTGAALGHKLSGQGHNEHTHTSSHGGLVSSHSHNERGQSSGGHFGHASLSSGVVGAVTGAALGHKLSGQGHNEHTHTSSHGGLVGSHSHNEHTQTSSHGGLVSSHSHNEHGHSSGGHSGHANLASGVVGAVTGAVLGNKLSSHTHKEHSHSSGVYSGHASLASGAVGAVTGAVLGNKLSSHSHNELSHSSSNNHGGLVSGVVGTVTGAARKLTGNSHNEHTHTSSHGGHGSLAGTVAGATLGHKLTGNSHTSSHGSLVGTVAGATLGHKLSSQSHNEHSHNSNNNHGGLVSGVVSTVTGAARKLTGNSYNEHTHTSSHGGHGSLIGTVAGATLGHKLSSQSHNEHSQSSSHGGLASGIVGAVTGAVTGAVLGNNLSNHSRNEHGHSHSGHGGDVVTQTTTKIVEGFTDPRTPLMHERHENHQAVTDSRARFGENSHHEHTTIHESRGREHGSMGSAVTGAVERIVGHGNSSHGRSHSGSRHSSSAAGLVHRANGSHNQGHSTHGRDGQTIIRSTETVNQWRDEANAVEDLRRFGVASTVNEDSRSDFGETLHKGHSIVGHGHNSRFGDDAVVHDGHGHTVIEKTQITRVGETLHDGGHSHSHGSHGHDHRHSESHSNFGDAALHTDGRTIVEKTEVTRIGGTTHNAHSHNATPTHSRFEDAAINKVVERTQITQFGETHQDAGLQQQHRSHNSYNHGHNNGAVVGNDGAVTRNIVRETEWLGKKALIGNATSLNTASINTAAATTGSNNVTTVTRTEEFWPVGDDAGSSVYNFLDEDIKEVGGVKIESRTTEGGWWSDKRGQGYN